MKEFAGTERFEVVRRLGAGGMGVVYLAHDRERSSTVALKTLPELTPSTLYRFKQEFRAASELAHPNLIQLYELFAGDGEWFFTMEYVVGLDFIAASARTSPSDLEGPSPNHWDSPTQRNTPTTATQLADTAIGNAPMPGSATSRPRAFGTPICRDYAQLRSILRQIAEGLTALHRAGRLHRDIKPSNIIVESSGRAVLLDFGLALDREAADELATDRHAGTHVYMSPEQAQGRELQEATDWYSVGVTLYQALTGNIPHSGETLFELIVSKQNQDPPAPASLTPGIPDDLNEICLRLLDRDPARRLTGAELLEQLGAKAAGVEPVASRFVGRREELDVLHRAWTDLREGKPRVVEIRGNSGAGKSALLRRFLDTLPAAQEPVVLRGRCYEGESVPFKALDAAIDGLSRYLRRLPSGRAEAFLPRDARRLTQVFPVLDRVPVLRAMPSREQGALDPPEVRRRAFQALRELLSRIGDRHPLLLSIDDLQWGDDDSAFLLTELLRPPDAPLMLTIVSYRAEEATRSRGLQTLFQEFAKLQIDRVAVPVGPLPENDAAQLARQLMGESAGSENQIATIVRESGGNPFFVRELAVGGGRSGEGAAEFGNLDSLVWARVQRLDEEARAMLEAIAVAGHPVEQRAAFAAVGAEAWNAGVITLLRAERLVRTSGAGPRDGVETYHDRIRETVVRHLKETRRAELHLALARSLAFHQSADAERLAIHFDAGGDAASAGQYYQVAGEAAAASLAFRHAASLLDKALRLQNPPPDRRGKLVLQLAEAQANAGLNAEAARNYLDAAAVLPADQRLGLMRLAAYQYCAAGYMDQGTEAFANVLSQVNLAMPGSQLSGLLRRLALDGWLRLRGMKTTMRKASELPQALLDRLDTARLAGNGLAAVDIINASYFTSVSLALALRAGEPERLLRSVAWEGVVHASFNEMGRRRAAVCLAKAEEVVSQTAHPEGLAFLRMTQGIVEFSTARFIPAHEKLAEAEALFSGCTGVQWELAMVRIYQAWLRVQRGDYREMAAVVPAQYADARERGDLFTAVNLGQFPYLISLLVQDRVSDAGALLDECEAMWSPKGYSLQIALGGMGRCWLELYRGNAAKAWEIIEYHWRLLHKNFFHLLDNLCIYLGESRARVALLMAIRQREQGRDPGHFLEQARSAAKLLRSKKLAHGPVMGQVIEAGVAALTGDNAGAIRCLEDAVRRYETLGQGMLANTAKLRLGELRGGTQGGQEANEARRWLVDAGVVDVEAVTRFHVTGLLPR